MFTSVFAIASLAVSAFSAPLPPTLVKKGTLIVWAPEITSPSAGDVWNAGEEVTVSWNAAPPSGGEENEGLIVLAQVAEDGSYALDYNNPLASDFKLTEGEQTVTVPTEFQGEALETASNYAVVLFGDSGNLSDQFTINGEDGASDSSASAPVSGAASAVPSASGSGAASYA